MLLLLSGSNRFSFTCNSGWGCYLLVVCHGVVFQFGEHLFHSWGCDNHWWDNHWWDNHRWDSLSSLPLEIPINFATVRPPTLFRIFWKLSVRPSKPFQDIWKLSVRPKISSGYFLEAFRPPLNLFRIFSWKRFVCS